MNKRWVVTTAIALAGIVLSNYLIYRYGERNLELSVRQFAAEESKSRRLQRELNERKKLEERLVDVEKVRLMIELNSIFGDQKIIAHKIDSAAKTAKKETRENHSKSVKHDLSDVLEKEKQYLKQIENIVELSENIRKEANKLSKSLYIAGKDFSQEDLSIMIMMQKDKLKSLEAMLFVVGDSELERLMHE